MRHARKARSYSFGIEPLLYSPGSVVNRCPLLRPFVLPRVLPGPRATDYWRL